jgi:hypothetical protein
MQTTYDEKRGFIEQQTRAGLQVLSASFDKENIKPSRLSTPTDLKVIDIFGFRLGLTNLFDDDSVSSFAVTYRRSSAFDKAYTRDKETAATALAIPKATSTTRFGRQSTLRCLGRYRIRKRDE